MNTEEDDSNASKTINNKKNRKREKYKEVMTNNNYYDGDDHDDDEDYDYYYYDHNNNYDDLDKELNEALESVERQCKEGGLSGKETVKESISFIGEQQKQAILRYHSVLRVNIPLLISDEKLRQKVIKADNEMVAILQRQLDESIRMRKVIKEELREKMNKDKKGKSKNQKRNLLGM